jgi:glycosyltransferase involved in cell wall biosynthesis
MNQNLHILQIANQPGPLYLFMQPLSLELWKAGHEVDLACMPTGPMWKPLQECGFPVHSLPAGKWSNPLTWIMVYQYLREFFRENQFDLVIVHTPVMSWLTRLAAKGLVGKIIYFAHGLPFAPEQNPLMRYLFRRIEMFMARYTDAVIVMNRDDEEACKKYRLTKTGGQYFYVPGVGVDVQEYSRPFTAEEITNLEKEVGLRAGVPMVLFLGRFISAKRPGDVLEIARRIGPKADFVLAGEGPMWESIRRKARSIGPHVHVLKFTTRTKLLLARSSVLVLPSVFREGLPRVLLEASAAGKPCVAYDVRGSRDVIADGETGFLASPKDVNALYDAVNKLLGDESMRNRMGTKGREQIDNKFSNKAAISATMTLLDGIVDKVNTKNDYSGS